MGPPWPQVRSGLVRSPPALRFPSPAAGCTSSNFLRRGVRSMSSTRTALSCLPEAASCSWRAEIGALPPPVWQEAEAKRTWAVPLHQREDRIGILTGRASDCMKVAVAAAGRGTWKRSGCGGARNRAAPPPGDRAPARRHRPPGAPPPTRRGSRTRAPGGAAVREPPARGHCPDPAGGLQTLHRSARRSMTPWSGGALPAVLSRRVPSMPSFTPSRCGSCSRQPRRTSRKAALFPSPR